uniref:Mez3 n=1 Tax=Arundo donax TaxID=35708 RepID=A0A0A9GKW6_ARUDO
MPCGLPSIFQPSIFASPTTDSCSGSHVFLHIVLFSLCKVPQDGFTEERSLCHHCTIVIHVVGHFYAGLQTR